MKENLPFILLLDQRTLFNLNEKTTILLDFFFNKDSAVPYYDVLKKMTKILLELDCNNILKEVSDKIKLAIVFHIDKMKFSPEIYFTFKINFV